MVIHVCFNTETRHALSLPWFQTPHKFHQSHYIRFCFPLQPFLHPTTFHPKPYSIYWFPDTSSVETRHALSLPSQTRPPNHPTIIFPVTAPFVNVALYSILPKRSIISWSFYRRDKACLVSTQ